MKHALLVSMLAILSSCFEKAIDYRSYAFPRETLNYNLVNVRDPNDHITVDVSVLKTTPEQVWILKKYKEMNTESLEMYTIGETEITKTSHKVDGNETMGAPITFPRFVKSEQQFGPKKDSIYAKHSSGVADKCYLLDFNGGKDPHSVELSGRLGFDIRMRGLVESYCENNGLMALKIDDIQYIVDVKDMNGCTRSNTTSGTHWECSPTK